MDYTIKIFDFEVFAHDWLIVFSNTDGSELTVIHNDNAELKKHFLNRKYIWGGFNNKHYDNYIAMCIIAGATPEEVKECNDFIIGGNEGRDFYIIRDMPKQFTAFDLRDDIADVGLSLKAIEVNIGESIVESSISFNLTHKLSKSELEETIKYCKSDVANTVKLYHLRKDYLEGKISVGKLAGWDEAVCLPLTNPILTAKFLGARKTLRDDGKTYEPPPELKLEKYTEALEFFKNVDYDKELELEIAGVTQHYGWGGIHSAIPNYIDASTDKEKIVDIDVGSYYPSLIIQHNYASRSIPTAKGYEDVYKRRLSAKHSGDKATADTLKLVLNSTFGAMKNAKRDANGKVLYANPLYDEKNCNAICITGQLFLTDLCEKLEKVKGFKLIQTNTDGIMIKYPVESEKDIVATVAEWENRTRMKMEYTDIHRIIQKDVNNYIIEAGATYLFSEDGERIETKADKHSISTKGGWVSMYNGGSFKNNSLVIVHKALVEYFLHDIPPEDTINQATNILDFQKVCKTGSTYKGTVWVVNGEDVPVQKVNRVYATDNEAYGELYKVKDGRRDKIGDIPPHCLIDNDNKLQSSDISKQWYIDLAYKRIADFKGIKEGKPKKTKGAKKMAVTKQEDYSKENMALRLLKARAEFLEAKVKKSGKNGYAGFTYFELEDIVPTATKIMAKYGLLPVFTFLDDKAYALVRDAYTYPEDTPIEFTFTMASVELKGTQKIQNLGAGQTYARRYLWYLVLDVVENDTLDSIQKEGESEPASDTPKVSKKPATVEERKEAVKELTNKPMNKTQRGSIVSGLRKLKDADADKHATYIAEIKGKLQQFDNNALEITSKEAEDIMQEIRGKLSEG